VDTDDLISKHSKIGKETDNIDVMMKIVKDYFVTYRETETTIEIRTYAAGSDSILGVC